MNSTPKKDSGHRKFLGWNVPVAGAIAHLLLEGRKDRPVDLSETLILTPTRQAGRILRKELARKAAEVNTAIVGAQVVPTSFLFVPPQGPKPIAGAMLEIGAWATVLRAAPKALLDPVFPAARQKDWLWARQSAGLLQKLRAELCDGAETIRSVVARHADHLEEIERWQAMAELEGQYLQRLQRAGLRDLCVAKMEAAQNPQIAKGVRRLIVAAVPDPSLLALTAIRSLAGKLETLFLVQAPEEWASAFDAWGRPIPEQWKNRNILLDAPPTAMRIAQDPAGECREVIAAIADADGKFTVGDLAIGMADEAIAPRLQRTLQDVGMVFSPPAEVPLSTHPLARAMTSFFTCRLERRYADIAEWFRHTDVLMALEKEEEGLRASSLLMDMDRFRLTHLPHTLEDALEHFDGIQYRHGKQPSPAYGTLARALRWAEKMLSPDQPALPQALTCLQRIYRHVSVGQATMQDRDFRKVAEKIMAIFDEAGKWMASELAPAETEMVELLRMHVGQTSFSAERSSRDRDLNGWLELAWLQEPLLVVTGMREGAVPDTSVSDPFLPDSVRKGLGLRCDETRLARDAHLLTLLAEQRRERGRLVLTYARTNARGDVQKPSRLLFQVPPNELAARARRLFLDKTPPPPSTPAATMQFTLDSTKGETGRIAQAGQGKPVFAVTQFRAYLECPFRYFLRYHAELKAVDLSKDEPDAMDFGNLIHKAMQELGSDKRLSQEPEEKKVSARLEEVARAEATRVYGSRPDLAVQMMLDSAVLRLKAAARIHIQSLRGGWEILAVEHPFELNLGDFCVRGRIDRIERHIQTGQVRVMDFKTSDKAVAPAEAHLVKQKQTDGEDWRRVEDSVWRWSDLQLPLYAHYVKTTPGFSASSVVAAYIHLPAEISGAELSEWEMNKPPEWTEKIVCSAVACAKEAARRIQEGIFMPISDALKYDDLSEKLGLPLAEFFGLQGKTRTGGIPK